MTGCWGCWKTSCHLLRDLIASPSQLHGSICCVLPCWALGSSLWRLVGWHGFYWCTATRVRHLTIHLLLHQFNAEDVANGQGLCIGLMLPVCANCVCMARDITSLWPHNVMQDLYHNAQVYYNFYIQCCQRGASCAVRYSDGTFTA